MNAVAKSDGNLIIIERGKKSKPVFWIFFGILGFIALYIPFYGQNLRFRTSTYFSGSLTYIGTILVNLGVLILIWGLASLVCTKSFRSLKTMVVGFLLLYIGMWFISPNIGAGFGPSTTSTGYH